MARAPTKKDNAKKFEELMADGVTPEAFILQVAQGKRNITGKRQREQYEAAKLLLPYRLPRLNSIDAINKNVDMTQDDFIKKLSEEENE